MLLSFLLVLAPILSTVLALVLAGFVWSRNKRARTNRWLALGLSVVGAHQAVMLGASLVDQVDGKLALFRFALALMVTIPPSWLAFSLTFGESNGNVRFALWRPALLGLTAAVPLGWLALATGRVVQPVRLGSAGLIFVGLDGWGKAYFSLYLLGLALVLLHLENLYRSADRLTRSKIKLLVVGVFVAFSYQIVAGSYPLLFGLIHPLHPLVGTLGFLLGEGLIALSLVGNRLLDVDIFVSRHIIYRSLTLALIGGYLLSLGVIADVFLWLNITLDQFTGTFFAILGAVALSLVLLSEDVRRSTQAFIQTHFYRHKYDYQIEWIEFTHRLSKATAVTDIAAQTVNRILEVMWIHQAAMYTVAESRQQMALLHQIGYAALPKTLDLSRMTIDSLREQAGMIPSAAGREAPPDVTPMLVQEMFEGIPIGRIVPVAALDTLVGLLVVGPEATGKPFGVDDRDLLAAVAAQAGALIVNARLAQEVSEGRELQALARVSAFVTHDLKNAVSMLSMLAENAKLHMSKPDFQADAIRTLGEVAARMRKLLATLSASDRGTPAQLQPMSLAPDVETWMHELQAQVPSRIRVETRLDWTPDVRVNSEQLRSVLHNLVLNSIEAIHAEGTIQVETFQENGQAVLAVTDTGSGMTKEFIQHTLARPFETTKPRGLGIGLYQCRHLIHGFGGTLTVESEEGKGTRMVVRLPTEAGSRLLAGTLREVKAGSGQQAAGR